MTIEITNEMRKAAKTFQAYIDLMGSVDELAGADNTLAERQKAVAEADKRVAALNADADTLKTDIAALTGKKSVASQTAAQTMKDAQAQAQSMVSEAQTMARSIVRDAQDSAALAVAAGNDELLMVRNEIDVARAALAQIQAEGAALVKEKGAIEKAIDSLRKKFSTDTEA